MSVYSQVTTSVPRGNDSKKGAFVKVPVWLYALVADPDSIISGSHIMAWMSVQSHWSPAHPMPWPSMETIARETGCKVRRAHQLIAELEGVGALRRVSRGRNGGGGRTSNRYILATDGPLPIWTDDAPDERQEGPNMQPVAGELDTQDFEEEPPSQTQKASDIASNVATHETPREPITDPDTIEAVHALYDAIGSLSEDMEAATTWAVVQRVVDELTRHGCHALELADGLTSVTDTLWDKATGLRWGRGRPLDSPVGFVMWVAEVAGVTHAWEEVCPAEYWREAETMTGVNLTGTAA